MNLNKLIFPIFILLIINTLYCCKRDNNTTGIPINNYSNNPEYKHKKITDFNNDYSYNYDVSGIDNEGYNVSGNIDISGKYGSVTIQNESGDDIYIDVEWVGLGELEATDDEGNTYELEVD